MNQKDAVFSAVVTVLTEASVDFTVGVTDLGLHVNKALRSKITNLLVQQFAADDVKLSTEAKAKLNDNAKMRTYVSGLISNWLRKDTRLNGGKKETVTRKRASVNKCDTDSQIKALKLLLKTQIDADKKIEIQSFIDKRIAELQPTV